jgi:hypothetical protein
MIIVFPLASIFLGLNVLTIKYIRSDPANPGIELTAYFPINA